MSIYINDKVSQESSPEDKLKALLKLKICIPEIAPSKDLWYTSKNRSTLDIFKEALLARIEYYENELKPGLCNTVQEQHKPYESLRPVKINLKVSHLAILCRLMIDEGHFPEASCTEVTNALASVFQMKNSEPISQYNLRNKIYSHDLGSLYEFKETLNSWSEKIDNLIYNLKYK